MKAKSVFFTGGGRSGKSSAAQKWAEAQAGRRVFIATAEARDPETASRIALHQAARGEGWNTLELPCSEAINLTAAFEEAAALGEVILLDCLSLWTSACMENHPDDAVILRALRSGLARASDLARPLALVSNEAGLGMVPMHPEARRFRDLLGLVNQEAARFCDSAAFMVSGLPLMLKGSL